MDREPRPQTLDSILLHGRSLATWHRYLTTNHETGEPAAHLLTPCSRYGRDADECSYWAIACEVVYADVNGSNSDEDPTQSFQFFMGLAVNDSLQVAYIVDDYWYAVPDALRDHLGTAEEVRALTGGSTGPTT